MASKSHYTGYPENDFAAPRQQTTADTYQYHTTPPPSGIPDTSHHTDITPSGIPDTSYHIDITPSGIPDTSHHTDITPSGTSDTSYHIYITPSGIPDTSHHTDITPSGTPDTLPPADLAPSGTPATLPHAKTLRGKDSIYVTEKTLTSIKKGVLSMKIKYLDKSRLRNDEHFMFHTEFRDLLSKTDAVTAKVQTQFDAYISLYNKEDEGLKKITKSALTAKIHEEDKIRDELYIGMTELNAALLRHPNEEKREAAKRLKILFNTYGNIAKKPVNEQTSAVINILQELKGGYANDAELLGLKDYIIPLVTHNDTLNELVKGRYDEAAAKTDVVIREARVKLDAAYDDIAARINALELIEGGEIYTNVIKTLNVVITKYNAVINARTGRKGRKNNAAANDGDDTDDGDDTEDTEL